ncbi:MAG: hypothetical protein GY870_12460 [archaeon]|nr:hypothetical protein [archaeon]
MYMSEDDIEVLDMGDGCKLTFDKQGNVVIGDECAGTKINPVEIQLLDKVNQDNEAT